MHRHRGLVVAALVLALAACGGSASAPPPPPPSAGVPGPPTGVAAVAGVRSATVSWTAPPGNGGTILGYTVTVSPGGATLASSGIGLTVSGLASGATYIFMVTATNGLGTGPASAPSPAVTTPDLPGAPTGLTAVAADRSASLAWTAPASDGGRPLTGYTVLVSPAAPSASFSVTETSATVTNLANGTSYVFQVLASNAVGDGPPSPASAAVTPFTTPSAPGQPTAVPGHSKVTLGWPAPASDGGSPVTGYTVTASPGGATASSATTGATLNGLSNGAAYTFTVAAVNAAGTGPASPPSVAVTPSTQPGAPTAVTAVAGIRGATVSWNASPSNGSAILGYTVTVSPGGATVHSATTSTAVTGLANGSTYTFTVTATNGTGTGPSSAPSPAVTTPDLPGTPTGLIAVAADRSASLAWTAPASDGGRPLTGYTVLVSPAAPAAAFTVTGTGATVSGLANGNGYVFQVLASNAVGDGPPSPASAAVTPFTTPSAPGRPVAAAGNAQATLTWTAPASDGGSPVTGYTVTASPGGAVSSSATTGATVTGLSNGTAYTFTVAAVNAAGAGQASTPSAAVTPSTLPGAPTAVAAVAGIRGATVSWTAAPASGSAITGYTVTVSPGGATVHSATTSATVTGLANGTTYTFTVTATNGLGTGPASSPSAPVATPDLPGAPTGLIAVAADRSASLAWSAPASDGGRPLTGYTVLVSPAAPSAIFSVTGTSATVTNLANGTSHVFQVLASNAVGKGPPSLASAPVTPFTTPSAPGQPTAAAGNAQATLTWTAPASDGGSPVTGYTVTASPASPGGATASSATTSATVSGLSNGTAYTFTVAAVNAAGTGPASTRSVAVTPSTLPGAPTAVTAVAGIRGAAVSWTAAPANGSAITGYTVTATPGGATQAAASTSATVSGLADGTSYTFIVTATNGLGTGPASSPSAPVTTPDLPGAPTGLTAAAADASAYLAWSPPASTGGRPVTGYSILVSPPAPAAAFAFAGASATVGNLANGTTYAFRVLATTAVGDGPPSEPSSDVTPIQAPSALAYSQDPAVYTRGQPITPNTPSHLGGPVAGFSISPPLPAGLGLDPTTGVVSGTPAALAPAATYTVTASNAGGTTTASLAITVNDLAPAGLAYSLSPAIYVGGSAIAPNLPSSGGGAVVAYAVSPALPPGLSLDGATGAISGTPTAVRAATSYVVTASNSGGSASAAVVIEVVAPAPPVISTGPAAQTVYEGLSGHFGVVASGAGPLSYQWHRNGAAVAGAVQADHVTPPTTLADDGAAYTVAVGDGWGGQVTSAAAVLGVLPVSTVAIAVLNDVHLEASDPMLLDDIAGHLAAWPPALLHGCGDVDDDDATTYDFNVRYVYLPLLSSLGGDRSYTFGNHDTENTMTFAQARAAWPTTVRGKWLPDLGYGSFDVGGVHVVLLDAQYDSTTGLRIDAGGGNYPDNWGHLPAHELTWLQADLAATTKPTIVFSHQTLGLDYPISQSHDWIDNQAEVRALLEAAPAGVLAAVAGHAHGNARSVTNGILYVVQTSTYDQTFSPGYTPHDGAAYLRLTVNPVARSVTAESWEQDSVAGWRLGDSFSFTK